MNIVLTQKDADSIIRYLRGILERITEVKEEASRDFKRLCDEYENNQDLKDSKHCSDLLKETSDLYKDSMKDLDEERYQILDFIELLTAGSEVA